MMNMYSFSNSVDDINIDKKIDLIVNKYCESCDKYKKNEIDIVKHKEEIIGLTEMINNMKFSYRRFHNSELNMVKKALISYNESLEITDDGL